MDKKQINDPKMTWNFLIWVGGVFMLSLFALLAHFVWRLFILEDRSPQEKWPYF